MSHGHTTFIAFGHRCSAAAILDRAELAGESFPFDSVVSKLSVIKDCLETDFKEFLDIDNYMTAKTTTVNVIDGVVEEILSESPKINIHYEDGGARDAHGALVVGSTYQLKLALTHHDMQSPQDYESFMRRTRRLREVLAQGKKKVCFYIHPVMGISDYQENRAALIDEFVDFSEFLGRRYRNTFGLFLVLVKLRDGAPKRCSDLIHKSALCSVYVIYVNEDFVDANAPFTGTCEDEIQTMVSIVRQPEFLEATRYKIYFPLFDHDESRSNEVRQTLEGLVAHPRVAIVDRPEIADYLILCQNHLVEHCPFHAQFRPIKDKYIEKTILLDFGDDPGNVLDADDFRWRLYFKRSCVDREHGTVMSYGGRAVQATAYCVMDGMYEPPASASVRRSIDVSCLFDDGIVDVPHYMDCRGRLLRFAKRFAHAFPQFKMQIGEVSESGPVGRSSIDPRYKHCLYDTKIVLHANPDRWEGDSRLWEALASGALVFVDRMYAPIRNPLIDLEHLIFYDLTDEGMKELQRKLIYYLNNDAERKRIATQGRDFVITHHRSLNRVAEIIRELECTSPLAKPSRAADSELDIIVSIATGYDDIGEYRQFISTLRRTGATCPVFLGISDGPRYETVKRYLLDNSVNYFIVPAIEPPNKVVNGYRFYQYRHWLGGLDFRYALMMDFRDAYFQRDPFVDVERAMRDCDLYLMSEFQLLTVGNHPNGMNYAWVADPFGKAAADAIADKAILNSGAIMGRKNAVMKFLDTFAETTTQQDFEFADQGTLNYLAHTGRLDHCGRIKTVRAGESLVNNCGFSELDLLRRTRIINAEDEARIAFIPRSEDGRLKLWRDHEGWVLDDDGNVSHAVHQYDRFLPEMHGFVSRLSDYECPDQVFVNSGTRRYRGEKFFLSSRKGLKPDAVERLIRKIKSVPVHKKPMLVLDAQLKRGFVFAYGILSVELMYKSESFRQKFFEPACDPLQRARFLNKWGYELVPVEEEELFLARETPRTRAQTAKSFSEARAEAERWTSSEG